MKLDNNIKFLKGFNKALIDLGYVDKEKVEKAANGFEELDAYLKDAVVSEDAEKIAKLYGEAKKAIIVVDEDTVSEDAIKLLADAAVITGKIGKPHRGIIIVRSKCNTQGFIDIGIKTPGNQILEGIEKGEIKGAVIIGEDLAGADESTKALLKKLDFVAAFDVYMTETGKLADVVIPISSAAESEGTFTRSDRKIQRLEAAVKPMTGRTTFDILAKLGAIMDIKVESVKQTDEMISHEFKSYGGLHTVVSNKMDVYTPCSRDNAAGEQVLFTEGFMGSDAKADLGIPETELMFKTRKVYDTLQKRFEEYLKEKGLKS